MKRRRARQPPLRCREKFARKRVQVSGVFSKEVVLDRREAPPRKEVVLDRRKAPARKEVVLDRREVLKPLSREASPRPAPPCSPSANLTRPIPAHNRPPPFPP
eukprot:1558-Chlamydomonas_euryale.AAC.1